ncbi:hypothetical protein AVEN_12140-1, partial [Araneus ventricosus]
NGQIWLLRHKTPINQSTKVKNLEKQIAFTEGKLTEADKVKVIISEVCKENVKLFNKIEEISKVSAPSFADIVQRERSASRTRIIDPQKTCALVSRPKGKSTHDETRKKLENVVTLRNLPVRIKKFKVTAYVENTDF